jgi:tryptophan-rich sensory protein
MSNNIITSFTRKLSYFFVPAIVFVGTILSGYFIGQGEINWYYKLSLPDFAPFGNFISAGGSVVSVITTISVLYVWNKVERNRFFYLVILLFLVNVFLNTLWSWVFFVKHLIGLTVVVVALLEVSTLALTFFTRRISSLVFVILVPYVLWVTYLEYFVYVVWKLNA